MKLSIDQTRLNILIVGNPQPVLNYGTDIPKTTSDGRPLFKVPVLLSGTDDRTDPTTFVIVPGPVTIQKGQSIKFKNLSISTWTMRDSNGKEKAGVTLRAEGVEADGKQNR